MSEQTSPTAKGTIAPDYTPKEQNGFNFSLSTARGKKVLLSFYPMAWTNICTQQMKFLEAKSNTFVALNTITLGISIDAIPIKKTWVKSMGITETRLLSDA